MKAQEADAEVKRAIDGQVASAYQTIAAGFPCKIKTSGKVHMMRWQEVDKCLNAAAQRISPESFGREIVELAARYPRSSRLFISDVVEKSLDRHALPFEKIFIVKDQRAQLPLTNSLLRFLPPDSLQDLPVTDRVGTQVGAFAGTYGYERAGGLAAANLFKLTLFQYEDSGGVMRSAPDKLLLDSFGVPWRLASSQPGFRLPVDLLKLGR